MVEDIFCIFWWTLCFLVLFCIWDKWRDIFKLRRFIPFGNRIVPRGITDIHAIDGDTLKISRNVGCRNPDVSALFGTETGDKTTLRLYGVDAAETSDKEPAYKMLADITRAICNGLLSKAKRIEIRPMGKEKYGRGLVSVILDGSDLSETLLGWKIGGEVLPLVVKYGGENKKKAWNRLDIPEVLNQVEKRLAKPETP